MSKQLYLLSYFNGQSDEDGPSTYINGVSTSVNKLKKIAQQHHKEDWCDDGVWDEAVNKKIDWDKNGDNLEGMIDEDCDSYYIIEPVDNYDN